MRQVRIWLYTAALTVVGFTTLKQTTAVALEMGLPLHWAILAQLIAAIPLGAFAIWQIVLKNLDNL